jgi:hypothetical protein
MVADLTRAVYKRMETKDLLYYRDVFAEMVPGLESDLANLQKRLDGARGELAVICGVLRTREERRP